jgi:hypothetical protein
MPIPGSPLAQTQSICPSLAPHWPRLKEYAHPWLPIGPDSINMPRLKEYARPSLPGQVHMPVAVRMLQIVPSQQLKRDKGRVLKHHSTRAQRICTPKVTAPDRLEPDPPPPDLDRLMGGEKEEDAEEVNSHMRASVLHLYSSVLHMLASMSHLCKHRFYICIHLLCICLYLFYIYVRFVYEFASILHLLTYRRLSDNRTWKRSINIFFTFVYVHFTSINIHFTSISD